MKVLLHNFEMVLVLVLVGSLFFINYFVVHKFAFLLFYFIPVLLAGFYLSARYAVATAVLSSGFVVSWCTSRWWIPSVCAWLTTRSTSGT
jgi:hypothetical protein